jgi:ATP-dependent Zn protease
MMVPELPLAGWWRAAAPTWQDIAYDETGGVGFLHFEFYNGAMSTAQCERLREALAWAKQRPVRILVLMGGRAAEQLVFKEITTGAQDDLMKATSLASKMVCEYGMSDDLGPVTYKKAESEVFLGRDLGHERGFSEETSRQIDQEVKKILSSAMEKVKDLLAKNRDKLEALAKALTEKEILNADDVNNLLGLSAT